MPDSPARRVLLATGLAIALVGLTACEQESPFGEQTTSATSLVASPAYVQTHDTAQDRLESLRIAIDRLRASTGSGWVGRQDDVTGYLTELSGGRFGGDSSGGTAEAAAQALLDDYGLDLFGIAYADLDLSESSAADITGSASMRGQQVVDGVPVLDGELIFSVADPDGEPAISSVRGRVFPDLEVSTDPQIGERQAVRIARRLSGGQVPGEPQLTVVATGTGHLTWEVVVQGATSTDGAGSGLLSDGRYFISATDGEVVMLRPTSASHGLSAVVLPRSLQRAVRALPADPRSVEVTGQDPQGQQVTAVGIQTPDGVALVDTTVPTYDDATGDGAIITYTAQDGEEAPGQLYVERSANGTTITDPEAIASQAVSRAVYDYYASLGRASWDGAGGTLLSTINFGSGRECNSFFNGDQMIYGNPCLTGEGLAQSTMVEIDVAGHEITHGVIDSSSALVYSGQSGALNESFADYFGNVIGNQVNDSDSVAVAEGTCSGITSETRMCHPNPDGSMSLRYMLNGATLSDYIRLLNPTLRMRLVYDYDGDNGGVHLNSAIWNNALWTIRTRLAKIEGTSGNDSQLATDFDKIVYAALTTQITAASDFLDARAAIERTIVDAGADPKILDVARETFELNDICENCVDTGTVNGSVVARTPQTEIEPVVSGDEMAWVDLSQGAPGIGFAARSSIDGTPSSLTSTPEATQVVFAGAAAVTLEVPGLGNTIQVRRYDESGAGQTVAEVGFSTLTAGLGGSAEGAAWVSSEEGTASFLDPAGQVVTDDLPDLGGSTVTAVGTGQGYVGLGTDDGRVLLWEPGAGFTELGSAGGTIWSIAAYGPRVLVTTDSGVAALFDADGTALQLSGSATQFGAALNGDYAVWAEGTGVLGGAIADELGGAPDTDLYLYSFETGTIYNLLAQTGQQGYPAISGDRLVWQDTVFGGNDVLTATLPSGL